MGKSKMNCRQIEELIFSKRLDELTPAEKSIIEKHISSCHDCKSIYESVQRAESVLVKMKIQQPILDNEEILVDSIMQKVNSKSSNQKYENEFYFFEKLILFVSQKSVRYALTAILFIMVSLYMFEEYSAVKNITQLENQLNNTAQVIETKAEIISFDNEILKFFYDAYKFARGNSSYVKLSKDWLLVNKEDLKNLLLDYEKLDEHTKTKIKSLQNELLNQKDLIFSETETGKMKTLQLEIERLNSELQKIKSRRGK
ncbi:MAG: zf-HC2 domain-containing protein [Ignavibacteriales bacterium]|nr:zf-HC2 domain-containing protein [Ignavibacteriales bacterium]